MDLWINQASGVARSRRVGSPRSSLDSLVDGDAVAVDAGSPLDQALAFSLRLARALLSLGMSAHRVEESLDRLATTLDLDVEAMCTPTALFVTLGTRGARDPSEVRTRVVRVEPGHVDLERLGALHDLVGRVERREITAGDAAMRVEAILARPARYRVATTVAAHGLLSASASMLLGGAGLDVPVAGAMGLFVGGLEAIARPLPGVGRLLPSLAAFALSFLATLLGALGWPVQPSIVLLAGLIVLLPGFTFTTATIELASAHLVSGTARATGAMVTFLQLGFGVALGQRAASLLPALPALPPPEVVPIASVVAAALLSAVGFSVVLRARPSDARWVLLAVVLALSASRVTGPTLGPELGAFVTAFVVAAASNLFARLADRPVHVMLLPGSLLVVPGSLGFLSVRSLLEDDALGAVSTGFRMALVAMAIAAGVLAATAAVPPRKAI